MNFKELVGIVKDVQQKYNDGVEEDSEIMKLMALNELEMDEALWFVPTDDVRYIEFERDSFLTMSEPLMAWHTYFNVYEQYEFAVPMSQAGDCLEALNKILYTEGDARRGFRAPALVRFIGAEDSYLSNSYGEPVMFVNIEDHISHNTDKGKRGPKPFADTYAHDFPDPIEPNAMAARCSANFGTMRTSTARNGPVKVQCARIAGVEVPNKKRIETSLTYIFGIGLTTSQTILEDTGIENKRTYELDENELKILREEVEKYMVEGDLRRFNALNIKRLKDISCYRGRRHAANLPLRGQRTKTNARTRKGRAKTVANKKK
eukprot:jgi/Pico_ML_1/52233/g2968.t3